jgi:DNA helicase-2/ATP-dependent DNA helicase PcrA
LLLLDDEDLVAGWDADIEQLLAEARASRAGEQPVQLPASLSATAMLRLRADPEAYAAELARPMPRPPSRAARFGTRFHLWVERYFGTALATGSLGQQLLIDPDDVPDPADETSPDEQDLRALCDAFASGQFGGTVPYAIEAPFSLGMAGRLVRGRIDAVYQVDPEANQPRARFLVVDWKTGTVETADPLQLAIYRLAWAEAMRIPPEEVDAAFYYVRTDRLVRPESLPGRSDLEDLLTKPGEMATSLSG